MPIIKERINKKIAEYVSELQAAAMLQLSAGRLRNLRTVKSNNQPIPFIKNGGKVLYKKSDVIAYGDRPKFRPEHEYPRIPILFNETPLPDLDSASKLTTAEAALIYGISKASLQIWRSKRQFLTVLPFHGGHSDIHYVAAELATFITEGRSYWKARSVELGIQFQPHPRSGRAA